MFKRFSLIVSLCAAASLLIFTACEKKEASPATDVKVDAAAPAADPNAAAPAPAADPNAVAPAADPNAAAPAPAADPNAVAPAADAAPADVPIPPEAQAALDEQINLMNVIAAAAEKESCTDVLAGLKEIPTSAADKAQAAGKQLENLPEDVQRSLANANQSKLIAVTMKFMAFQKCESTPEKDLITAEIERLLKPVANEPAPEAAAPAAAAPAAAPAAQ